MATITFTATGTMTPPVTMQSPDNADVSISGSFVATILLKRRRVGDTVYLPVKQYTIPTADIAEGATGKWEWTFECTDFTSGAAVCSFEI